MGVLYIPVPVIGVYSLTGSSTLLIVTVRSIVIGRHRPPRLNGAQPRAFPKPQPKVSTHNRIIHCRQGAGATPSNRCPAAGSRRARVHATFGLSVGIYHLSASTETRRQYHDAKRGSGRILDVVLDGKEVRLIPPGDRASTSTRYRLPARAVDSPSRPPTSLQKASRRQLGNFL